MRLKQLWDYVPLPTKLKLVWDRLMFSRLTIAYILFSIVHCILQVAFQADAFVTNANAADFLYGILIQGHATNDSLPTLTPSNLEMCAISGIAGDTTVTCQIVWDGSKGNNSVIGSNNAVSLPSGSPASSTSLDGVIPTSSADTVAVTSGYAGYAVANSSPTVDPAVTVTVFVLPSAATTPNSNTSVISKRSVISKPFDSSDTVEVTIDGSGFNDVQANVDRSCLWSLNWPVTILDETKREDVAFIAFQIWVLGMSAVALLNESIPHILASLLTHIMATAWASFQISNTASFRANFNRVISRGACAGIPNLLPHYWEDRARAEVPILALNVVSLLVSCFLTWKLVKLFGWQTFKRVGASLTINRIYRCVLVLSIVLQLSLYFMAVTVALWLDQLFKGPAAHSASYSTLYKATFIITLVLLVPWLTMGWVSIRKELRLPMFFFLLLSVLYMAGWSVMFLATTFRWTFINWRFFSVMAVASVLLTLASFILGVVCRYNFGKGLPRYLNAQEPLAGDDFVPVGSDMEKVAFPSDEKPIPTYSATFGSGPEVPVPSQMFAPRLGPRFFNASAEPFETPSNSTRSSSPRSANSTSPVAPTMAPLTRIPTSDSSRSAGLVRSNTRSSEQSYGSIASYYDYSGEVNHSRSDSRGGSQNMQGKRWAIE